MNKYIILKRITSSIVDFLFALLLSIYVMLFVNNFSGLWFPKLQIAENPFLNDVHIHNFTSFLLYSLLIAALLNSFFFTCFKGNSVGKRFFKLKNDYEQNRGRYRELIKFSIVYLIPILLYICQITGFIFLFGYWIILFVINVLCLCVFKTGLIDAISKSKIRKDSETTFIFSRWLLFFSSLLIDVGIIYIITYVLHSLLLNLIYFDFFNLLLINWSLYQIISIPLRGKTLGKSLLGITYRNSFNDLPLTVLKRTIFILSKVLFTIGIPYLLMYLADITDPYSIFMVIVIFGCYFSFLSYILCNEALWNKISNVSATIIKINKKKYLLYTAIVITVMGGISFAWQFNNKIQSDFSQFLGFNAPFIFQKYPNDNKVQVYTNFLKQQTSSPKNYILDLFKKYDIVILCENIHGESTQWDLITEVVQDSSFVNQVGFIFTEYGSAKHQGKIDTFLNKRFYSNEELEKATACLMTFMSGGYYQFLKNINLFNNKLVDSLKIKVKFTDIIDWDYFPEGNRWDISDIDKRDSIMAQTVITWYENQKNQRGKSKCLVVTNYRHAFGYPLGIERFGSMQFLNLTSGNQAQYIFNKYPQITANVLQGTGPISLNRIFVIPFYSPAYCGVWERAFEESGNNPVGFNLKGNTFGNTFFDMYPTRGEKLAFTYADFFTGIIFNKPFREFKDIQYPYQRFAAQQEWLKKKGAIQSNSIPDYYKDEPFVEKDSLQWVIYLCLSNFVGILFLWLSGISVFLIASFHFFRLLKIKKSTN